MNTRTEERIDYDSPEAASIQTVTGWVSSTGQFWGKDERTARYVGSTHRICKVNPAHGEHRTNSYCEKCWDEKRDAKWSAMPRRAYDGTPVVVFDGDTFFFDAESIAEWLDEHDIKPEDARLVFCKPNYPCQIDPNEHFTDDLPEDGEVSAALYEAFKVLNAVIAAEPPMSWTEGNEAVTLPANFWDAA